MKIITITCVLFFGMSATNFAQTNRINHFSHSGTSGTLSIFDAADNMGCGEPMKEEYVPDTKLKPLIKVEKIDTTKTTLKNAIEIPKTQPTRKGMSLTQNYDARLTLKKFN